MLHDNSNSYDELQSIVREQVQRQPHFEEKTSSFVSNHPWMMKSSMSTSITDLDNVIVAETDDEEEKIDNLPSEY